MLTSPVKVKIKTFQRCYDANRKLQLSRADCPVTLVTGQTVPPVGRLQFFFSHNLFFISSNLS